jgi:hypothetical protein
MTELQKLRNIGKRTEQTLLDIGIKTSEELCLIGPEEVMLRIFEKKGWQNGMCTCFLYALEGAITNTKWNEIPEKRKKEFLKFVKDLRASLPGAVKK